MFKGILRTFTGFLKRFNLINPGDWKAFMGVNKSKSGVSVTQDTAISVSTVWACIMKKSKDFAALPKGIVERMGESRQLAADHDQYWLIKNRPHPQYNSFDWFKTMVIFHESFGVCYARIDRNPMTGRPTQYTPLHPAYIEPFYSDEEKTDLWFKNWRTGELIQDADIIRVSNYSLDPLTIKSPITVFRDTIGMAIAQIDAASELFANNMRSDGWIKYTVPLNNGQANFLRKNWDERMGSWQTPILDQNGEYKEFGMPLTDAQFIQNRKFQVEEICRIFGMDPTQIGHVEAGRATGQNQEEHARSYVQDAMLPLCVAFEQELAYKTLRLTERRTHQYKVDLNGLLRGNTQAQMLFFKEAINSGMMMPDECRALQDMNPLPADQHGNQVRIPMNLITGEHYAEYINSVINKGVVNVGAEA